MAWNNQPPQHPIYTGYLQIQTATPNPWNKPDGSVVQKFDANVVELGTGQQMEMAVWASSLFNLLIPGQTYEADWEVKQNGEYTNMKIKALRPWAGNPPATPPRQTGGPGVPAGGPQGYGAPPQQAPVMQPGVPVPYAQTQAAQPANPMAYQTHAPVPALDPTEPTKDDKIQRQNALNAAAPIVAALIAQGNLICPYQVEEVDLKVTPEKRNEIERNIAGWASLQVKRVAGGIEGFAARRVGDPVDKADFIPMTPGSPGSPVSNDPNDENFEFPSGPPQA